MPSLLVSFHAFSMWADPADRSDSGPDVDAAAVSQLEAMGFPTVRCQKALLATGNSGADMAMTWLFEHMEDPGKPDFTRTWNHANGIRYR
jgi:uncharacterized UBP type Zn finger protein